MTTAKKRRPRPKPKRHPQPRLTSYQRALRDASARLDQALHERTECLQQLQALDGEIPYLEGIIRSFTPTDTPPIDRPELDRLYARAQDSAPAPDTLPNPNITPPLDPPVDQADFLARFMPRPGRTTTQHPSPLNPSPLNPAPTPTVPPPQPNSDDPDEFLTDDSLGHGTQLIE